MAKDPIVEEVRAARDAYAKKFGYDLTKIVRDLQRKEKSARKGARPQSPVKPKRKGRAA